MRRDKLSQLPFRVGIGLLCGMALASGGGTSVGELTHPPPGYTLVWKDDFLGKTLDQSKWNYRTDVKVESSQRPENVTIEDGHLVIRLKKEAHRGKEFTGGGVISKRRFRYGYFEARVKMHGGAGWHQSVWAMAGAGDTTFHAGMRTEIDGMEFDSDETTKGHMGLLRWNGPSGARGATCSPGIYRGPLGFDAAADFHVYGFEWTETQVRYYLDGELRCSLDYLPSDHEHDPLNFWLTAIAVARHGTQIDESRLPGRMLVDHAHIYQKDIYLDDGEAGYREKGTWKIVAGYGYSHSDWRRSCEEDATAIWRPKLPVPGRYEVFLYRHLQRVTGGRASVEIWSSGKRYSQELDFTSGPAGWISLGVHSFRRGDEAMVRLSRADGCVSADMMKFVKTQ